MTYKVPKQPDERRHRFALDLFDVLLTRLPPRREFLQDAMARVRPEGDRPLGSDDGFADLLGVEHSQDPHLARQVCAVAVAAALVSNWTVTSKQYRDALGDLVAGLDAIQRLSNAFEVRESREAAPSSADVWRLIAAGVEAELAMPPRPSILKESRRVDEDGETISVGNLRAVRENNRQDAVVQSEQWNELLFDVARGATAPRPLADEQVRLQVALTGEGACSDKDISAVANAASRLLHRADRLDGRFNLVPTPAMTVALGALCLWDEYLQRDRLPDFRPGNKLQEIAWGLLDLAGVGDATPAQGMKSSALKDGMEKAIKEAAKVYVKLQHNPFLSSGKTGFWERQRVKGPPVAPAPTLPVKPFARYFSQAGKKND